MIGLCAVRPFVHASREVKHGGRATRVRLQILKDRFSPTSWVTLFIKAGLDLDRNDGCS